MKILVFDDSQTNRDSALAQLKGHNLTVVGTYDEAQRLLTPIVDTSRVEALVIEKYGTSDIDHPSVKSVRSEMNAYRWNEAQRKARVFHDFDIVLVDLLVPASDQQQGCASRFSGVEMSVGIFIALLALAHGKAKYAAVFTDSDHHSHPASACFDVFNDNEAQPVPFACGSGKLMLSNTRNWMRRYDRQDLSKPLAYGESSKHPDAIKAKDWAAVLGYLLGYEGGD